MSTLRFSLISDEREPGDLGRSLGVLFLCLLISVWFHLLGFVAWQHWDRDAVSNFYFELENESPPIELSLVMNQPEEDPAPAAPQELEITGPAETEIPENVAEMSAELKAALEAAQAGTGPVDSSPPPELDEELLNRELLPRVNETEGELNPDPPISIENEAPERKSYFTQITRAIMNQWLMPPEAKSQFRPGRFTADVTIARDGTLLRSVVIESTGDAVLDHAAHEAVRSAAPFPAFPPELTKFSQLEIRMNFDYQARYRPSGRKRPQ